MQYQQMREFLLPMKSLKNNWARRDAQFLPIIMSTLCLQNVSTKHNKYVVNQDVEHFYDALITGTED